MHVSLYEMDITYCSTTLVLWLTLKSTRNAPIEPSWTLALHRLESSVKPQLMRRRPVSLHVIANL